MLEWPVRWDLRDTVSSDRVGTLYVTRGIPYSSRVISHLLVHAQMTLSGVHVTLIYLSLFSWSLQGWMTPREHEIVAS